MIPDSRSTNSLLFSFPVILTLVVLTFRRPKVVTHRIFAQITLASMNDELPSRRVTEN